MKKSIIMVFLLVVMVATTLVVASTSVAAPSTADTAAFYKGKTVTLHCSGNPGTSSDLWARTIARHLETITWCDSSSSKTNRAATVRSSSISLPKRSKATG